MAALIYLDTNVVLWLAGAPNQISAAAIAAINSADTLLMSPMVELEIEYLYEVGRIQQSAEAVVDHLRGSLDLRTCERNFGRVVTAARAFKWTRDPFDRVITAQASLSGAVLLTRDKIIRANYSHAQW